MSKFVILLGGPLTIYPRLLGQVEGARVIAADGGIRHAEALGLTPEIWVGDFDSTDGDLELQYAEIPRLEYPAEKALTDGELALRLTHPRFGVKKVYRVKLSACPTSEDLTRLRKGIRLEDGMTAPA